MATGPGTMLVPFQLIGASLPETAGLHVRIEASSRYSAQIVGTALAGPKPAKGAGGQQAVNESIANFFEGRAPRLALPDGVAQVSQTVGQKRRRAGYAKDRQVLCAGRNRAPGEIGDEEGDDEAVGKPHPQELGHDRWAAGQHGQHSHRSLLVFFYQGGRLHLLRGPKREKIETALQAGGAQRSEEFVLIGELPVIAAVIGKQHVHDEAGDEDDDGRKQDREPEGSERNHTQPPSVRRRMQGFRGRGYACPEPRSSRAQGYIFWRGGCSYNER